MCVNPSLYSSLYTASSLQPGLSSLVFTARHPQPSRYSRVSQGSLRGLLTAGLSPKLTPYKTRSETLSEVLLHSPAPQCSTGLARSRALKGNRLLQSFLQAPLSTRLRGSMRLHMATRLHEATRLHKATRLHEATRFHEAPRFPRWDRKSELPIPEVSTPRCPFQGCLL